ncbi:hypothetical protein O181_008137 [Austropuccinia psidii MF-1]|uniref:Uncharacterized protein n=1 Tax=Austropuccinia psidii MF-1 TaxID=1389203 RepID=A0A9Q3BP53_9BASI|nr:hypothetical protein [Austropuccinia psidii MF-1]
MFFPGTPASNVRSYLWCKKTGHFGKEFPVSEAPTPDSTLGYSNLTGSKKREVARSEVPIPRINTEGVLKIIRKISNSPTNPDSEGSDELDGESFEVVLNPSGHQSSTSPSQPPAKRFQSQIIPSIPRNFQPVLSTIPSFIPPPSPIPSTARPALVSAVRPSLIPQPRNSPMVTSQECKHVPTSRIRREYHSPLPFPAAQVFHRREFWPIRAIREDTHMAVEGQDAVARLFRRVDRNSREVIFYDNDRNIAGTTSEEMAAKFAWYENELINYFQRSFDYLGRDN